MNTKLNKTVVKETNYFKIWIHPITQNVEGIINPCKRLFWFFLFLILSVQFKALSSNFQASGRPSEIAVNFVHLRPHAATVVSQNQCVSLLLLLYVSPIFIPDFLPQTARHTTVLLLETGT